MFFFVFFSFESLSYNFSWIACNNRARWNIFSDNRSGSDYRSIANSDTF